MKKNYKKAPFTKFHMMLYISTILGQMHAGMLWALRGLQ